ncbi:XrtA/PEP-CTERM system-associated ATPase [Denitrobaculum tricleocarpae]|uniref:AAA family ATPase n=1 Tax=Denitrobaculum tricleocarpae TaxID=2591009 RepID=A0A545TGC4_9PROT|nr:XrtA/PEP-CTERM system-associated ATPase [Denitrobaculum tricleocarpae]TQV76248.1 AAA family ATPase [Denitrobaculum tricleocarpae]
MYTDFYNLTGLPFQLTPDHRFFYTSQPHKKAVAYVTYGLSKGEGFIVITGEVGAGKTTLMDYFLSSLQGQRLITARVVTTQIEADNLLRLVAASFGLSQEGADKATILKRIEAFLLECHRDGSRPLLIIDEVQSLKHSSLEELRMLSNFQSEHRSLLQIYLVGQPEFRRTLASASLEQLRQRVIATYHLQPLDLDEVRSYIEHRLIQVGWQNDPRIDDSAYPIIYSETAGVPRRINLLCDRLLLASYLEDRHEISAADVEDVVLDMRKEGAALPPMTIAREETGIVQSPAEPPVGTNGLPESGSGANSDLDRLFRRVSALEGSRSKN